MRVEASWDRDGIADTLSIGTSYTPTMSPNDNKFIVNIEHSTDMREFVSLESADSSFKFRCYFKILRESY